MSDYNQGQQPPGGMPPGYPPQPGGYMPYPPPPDAGGAGAPKQGNGLAIAGMVLGIVSVVLFFIPILDIILALVGLILSIAGMSRANAIGGAGKGMAIAGLVTAIIGLLLGLYFTVAVFWLANEAEKQRRRYRYDLVLPVTPILVGAASYHVRRILGRVGLQLGANRGL